MHRCMRYIWGVEMPLMRFKGIEENGTKNAVIEDNEQVLDDDIWIA